MGKDIGIRLDKEVLALAHGVRRASKVGITGGRLETMADHCGRLFLMVFKDRGVRD